MNNKQFIFVVGVPRSGTTWLHQMIREHPEFCSLNGSNTLFQHYIFRMEKMYDIEKVGLTDKGFTRGMPAKFTPQAFHQLLTRYIEIFYEQLPFGVPFYVEKATDLLSELENIRRFIPEAKFVHIIRDGRNAALSDIKYRKKYGPPLGIENIYEAAERWKTDVSAFRRQAAACPGQVFEIKYEDLLVDTASRLQQIFRFIGADASPEITEGISRKFDYRNNPVSKPTSSVADNQGNAVQPYKTEMSKTDQAIFEKKAGHLLLEYGYDVEGLMDKRLYRWFIMYLKIELYNAKKSKHPVRFLVRLLRKRIQRHARAAL